jgi:hypothetical protein
MSSPEEEVRRLSEAVEGQDTKGTETIAIQANEAVEEQGTEAGTELEVEAGSSFKSIEEDQGIVGFSSTESEEGSATMEEQGTVPLTEPRQAPNVP